MTLADIRQICSIIGSTRGYAHKMRQYEREVKDIRRQLMWNTQMAQECRTLDHITDEMNTEECVLESMNNCLECSMYVYERYEERITEFAEEKSKKENREEKLVKFRIPENLFRLLY